MSNPGAASSGESMPDGLGLNAWWDEPGYKRCDSFSRALAAARGHLVRGQVERQIIEPDHRTRGERHAALDDGLELPRVARPVVAGQRQQRAPREPAYVLPELL